MTTTQNPAWARGRDSSSRDSTNQPNESPISGRYSTPIHVGRKVVGHVDGTAFHVLLHRALRVFRQIQGNCFDERSLHAAEKPGAQCAQITEIDTGDIYRVSISKVYRYGVLVNEGFGTQIGLPIKHWSQGKEPLHEQLTLWEGE